MVGAYWRVAFGLETKNPARSVGLQLLLYPLPWLPASQGMSPVCSGAFLSFHTLLGVHRAGAAVCNTAPSLGLGKPGQVPSHGCSCSHPSIAKPPEGNPLFHMFVPF